MIDTRIENITDLLKKMRDLSANLYEILAPEIMSYELVRADLERKRREMKDIEDQKTIAKMEIEKHKETAGKIISLAKDEAAKIQDSVKSTILKQVTQANELLDAAQKFVSEVDKKRYQKLRDDSEKAQKVVA